jgi:hypothetical protein
MLLIHPCIWVLAPPQNVRCVDCLFQRPFTLVPRRSRFDALISRHSGTPTFSNSNFQPSQAGAFGYYGEEEEEEEEEGEGEAEPASRRLLQEVEEEEEHEKSVPWHNKPLWNICDCCSSDVSTVSELEVWSGCDLPVDACSRCLLCCLLAVCFAVRFARIKSQGDSRCSIEVTVMRRHWQCQISQAQFT